MFIKVVMYMLTCVISSTGFRADGYLQICEHKLMTICSSEQMVEIRMCGCQLRLFLDCNQGEVRYLSFHEGKHPHVGSDHATLR